VYPAPLFAFSVHDEGLFPSNGGILSFEGKHLFQRWKKDCSEEGKTLPYGGRKISVRTQENFYAHKNKFPCARKFISLRKKIFRLPQGKLTS